MESAKVYFSDLRTDEISTLEKLRRLMKAAGFEQIDFKDKYVAVKLHFGEPGNMAYLRPNWARVVCDYVRALGGKPFLTDCNTLYVGGRANALDHLDSAMLNGYSPMTTGAQCIIADGLKGGDYDLVPIRGGKYLRAAKIGRAIMDADIFISLTHAKGHPAAGFGGALKNIGMGCGSRAGKEEMHSSGKPVVDQDKCIGCGKCIENCAHNGPHIENGKCTILKYKCTGCARCISVCPMHAIHPDFGIANEVLNCKIAEYAKAVVAGRRSTSRSRSTCRPAATVRRSTTWPWCRTWVCSRPSTPWRSIPPAPIRSMRSRPIPTASSRTRMTIRTTTSPPRIRTPTGAPPSSTARPSASARRTMSSSRSDRK